MQLTWNIAQFREDFISFSSSTSGGSRAACQAIQVGYEWLYLDTKDDLENAIRFCKRHGYECCDRYNSNPQATIFMRKQFSAALPRRTPAAR